jgi:hypothetical protein
MKSAVMVLVGGVLLCALAFCGFYYWGTASHRGLLHQQTPELAWLQKEFALSDAELARISKLHNAYQPRCMEMCRRIDEQGKTLKALLNSTNAMTPELEAALAESTKLRAECQRNMLNHFFEVSRTMPPAQGKRYLEWISERTFMPSHGEMSAESH